MIDRGVLEHSLIGGIVSGLYVLFPRFMAMISPVFVPAVMFLVREVTQCEYKYIERYCGGARAKMPLLAGFSPVVWDLHSLFGVLGPALAGAGVLGCSYGIERLITILI
jgi:hypothetical protein